MQKALVVLGALAVVLAITAGASGSARALITGAQVQDSSLTGADIQDRSLHFGDFTVTGESMIRSGWRLATGRDKVKDTMLDPALLAKINTPTAGPSNYLDVLPKGKTMRGVIAARVVTTSAGQTLWEGVTFPLPIPTALVPHVLELNQKTTECGGTYAAPTALGGHLCIYLGSDSDNVGRYSADAIGLLGMRFSWRSDHSGTSSIQATYAATAP